MKVKIAKEVNLTAEEPYSIVLDDAFKAGDAVAMELVLMADGAITIENEIGTQKVVNVSTLKVEEYSGGWAIIPCEGLGEVIITAAEDCKLTYRVLV